MRGIRSPVLIQGMVCITMIGNNNSFITVSFSRFDSIFHTSVNSYHSLFYRFINPCMTDHITIGIIYNDKVIFIFINSSNQFLFHFIYTHFGLKVISRYFRRRNQNTVFTFIWSFTATIKEECYVCIFFRFCNM